MTPVLEVEDLTVALPTARGLLHAVREVGLSVSARETLGLVGESGSGKSLTCRSIVRLLPRGAQVQGRIRLDGQDLLALSPRAMRSVRGAKVAMITQDPLASLNPAFTVGAQVAEAIALHQNVRGQALTERCVEILDRVGIPAPRRRMRDYPHQMSGGMRQRVVGAIALSCRPQVLLADEPTTSLDPTIQLQFLRLLRELQDELGFAMVFVTHDLGVIGRVCDRVAVMYAGRVVETAPTTTLFETPAHPYTQGLLGSRARLDRLVTRLPTIEGTVPTPIDLPPGCAFAPRCEHAHARCRTDDPVPVALSNGSSSDRHVVACWLHASAAP